MRHNNVKSLIHSTLKLSALSLIVGFASFSEMPVLAQSSSSSNVGNSSGETVFPVFAGRVKTGDISERIRTSGDVLPMLGISVNPEASGKIMQIFVDVGSEVKKGQKLAQIDDEVQLAQYQQALAAITVSQAAIETQKVNIESAKSSLISAKADVEAAESNLKNIRITKERNEKLLLEGAVSRQSVDDIITQYDAALARFTTSQTSVKRAQDAIQSALMTLEMRKAELIQAEANLNAVRVALGNCVVEAPFDGIITARNVDPGAMASPSGAMFKMEQNDPVKIIGSIIEKDIKRVKAGETQVEIRNDSAAETYTGVLYRIYPSVDSSSRTCKVEVRMDNKEKELRTGMFANMDILVDTHKNVVIVSRDTLLKHNNQYFTYVIENNRAVRRDVKIGITDDYKVEIVSGLKAGEVMITQGLEFVRVGGLVSYSLGE